MTTAHRMAAAFCCALVLGAGTAACGTDDGSTSSGRASSSTAPTAGSTPAVCADLAALRASADKIGASKVGQGALGTLTTELTAMQATLKRLADDASAQYAPQVDAVTTAGDSLDASLRTATKSPSAAALAAVGAAVRALGESVHSLATAVGNTC